MSVTVRIAGRNVVARIWKAQVGRVSVYLLDTNCKENATEDREITHRLYGGDASVRIRQEMILGLGGARALRALGMAPAVWHMNEGHAAFLILELVREGAGGLGFAAALEAVATQCVFTTHTPVAAGHDAFDMGPVHALLPGHVRGAGRAGGAGAGAGRAPHAPQLFNMTHLALNGARRMNGVSRIHGTVSARLCADHWPEMPPEQNPVGYVTNGVHVPTFLAQTWNRYFDVTLGPEWRDRLADREFWDGITRPGLRFLADRAAREGAHARRRARAAAARVSRQGSEPLAAAPHHPAARSGTAERADARALRAASPPTSAPRCMLRDRERLRALVAIRAIARCCSCSPARRIRPITRASRYCARSSS
jgi:alpha-glucan phosphorylase-like protein